MLKELIPQQLSARYARIIDDKSFAELESIFAKDAVIAAPTFECKNLTEFRVQLEFLNSFSGTLHIIGNVLGTWDEEQYQGETYCVASHLYEKDGVARKMTMGIRYQDEIGICDGEYKFTRRYLNVVWQQDLPLTDLASE